MILDFSKMDLTVLKNFKGGEKEYAAHMFLDEHNRIMHGTLIPGASIGMHTHEDSSEIIYILQGNGIAYYDGGEEKVSPGVCHYCPKGHTHSLVNTGSEDLVFFAVVPKQ